VPDRLDLLLCHRPVRAVRFASGYDLAMAGHAHGGQWRVGRQGLYSPGQGVLPRYTSGLYRIEDKDVTLVVSRGLGNHEMGIRIHNRPHLPVCVFSGKARG